MTPPTFPIERHPDPERALPALVTIPHYGTRPVPGVTERDFARPEFATFAYGYADAHAAALYGDLDAHGATVLASPYSRLFVDLNRRRDNYDVEDGAVRSVRGVVRTHTVRDEPIFAAPLAPATLEAWLTEYYDPFHRALAERIAAVHAAHGHVLLLDAHTASERGMGGHEIVVGTAHGQTCDAALAERAVEHFAAHGYAAYRDVRGYAGGHIVRAHSDPGARAVHALQIEVNSSLLIPGNRRDYVDSVYAGERPAPDDAALERLHGCIAGLLRSLAASLDGGARGEGSAP